MDWLEVKPRTIPILEGCTTIAPPALDECGLTCSNTPPQATLHLGAIAGANPQAILTFLQRATGITNLGS